MTDTINNKIPYLIENVIDPAAGTNLALNTVDALLQVLVQSVGADAPPTGVAGQRFIVGTAPTGAWVGQANKLARFLDGAWQFFDARYVLNAADGLIWVRSNSQWTATTGEWTAGTVSQSEAEAGTATTRRAWTALRVRQAVAAWWAGVSTAFGRSLIAANDATAARTSLGLGAGNSPTFTALTLSGGQLTFPATQVPSANANTLDDYEEGTWTPVLTFVAPGDLSVAYSAQEGTYTKIGRTVFLGIRVISSTFTHTNAVGSLQITGVPFSPSQAAFGAVSWAGFSKAGYTQALFTQTPGSIIGIRMSGNDLNTSLVSAADTASGSQISAVGNIFYDV